jgi:hypothetical protein
MNIINYGRFSWWNRRDNSVVSLLMPCRRSDKAICRLNGTCITIFMMNRNLNLLEFVVYLNIEDHCMEQFRNRSILVLYQIES